MLQQELTPAENTLPSATAYRVTPQEFAQAVSALESRRAQEERQQAETIPIADAVQHLGLDASEAEVLAEVEAMRRERTRREQQTASHKEMDKTLRLVALAVVGWFAFLSIVFLLVSNMNLRHRLDAATQSSTPLPMQLLSQVPANVPVHVDDVSLEALASGMTTSDKVSVDTRRETGSTAGATSAPMFNNEWTLVKSGQNIMVRAWATADQALRVSNNEAGAVFSSRPAWLPAANVVPVQLPIYRFAGMSGASFDAKGQKGSVVNGVLQAVDLSSTDSAVTNLVQNYLNAKQPGAGQPYYRTGYADYHGSQAEDNGTRVRLTGTIHGEVTHQRQITLANEVLQRAGVPATVVDELRVKPGN